MFCTRSEVKEAENIRLFVKNTKAEKRKNRAEIKVDEKAVEKKRSRWNIAIAEKWRF